MNSFYNILKVIFTIKKWAIFCRLYSFYLPKLPNIVGFQNEIITDRALKCVFLFAYDILKVAMKVTLSNIIFLSSIQGQLYKWEQIFMLKLQYVRIKLIPLICELTIKLDHV